MKSLVSLYWFYFSDAAVLTYDFASLIGYPITLELYAFIFRPVSDL